MKLTLSRRGLILVSIPLAFELLFIGTLSFLLKTSQTETAKEAEAKAVVFQTNRLFKHVYDASMGLFIYSTTRSEAAADKYGQQVAAIRECFAQLKILLEDNPERLLKLEKLRSSTETLLSMYTRVKSSLDEGGMSIIFMRTAGTQAEFHGALRKVMAELDQFSDEARRTEELAPAKLAQRQKELETILLLGVTLSVVVAVVVSLVFSHSITQRLQIMTKNAERFAEGGELIPVVKGEDEIALLDSVFHQMTERISESQRLKQHFMSMISHDLRSPLTALRLFLQNLAEGGYGTLDSEGNSAVKRAWRSTTDLIDMTGDLLEIEKSEAQQLKLHYEAVDLQALCEDAAEAVSWLAEHNGVSIETPVVEVQLQVDRVRLMRVLVNLLSNAIRYSPAQQSVTIKTDSPGGGSITVHVIDKGPGITRDNQSQIFDRFKQLEVTERKFEGSAGLGLVICKTIVEAHGGEIGLTSEGGSGCDFWFNLPLAASES